MKLFLAPHHDDLLLSLPAWLCARPHARPLHLAVLFSDESEELAMVCNRLHARLNVTVYPLGLTEAARRGLTARALLRRWRTADDLDDAQLRRTREALAPLLRRLAPAELVAPASLVHVDHALTRVAAEGVVAEGAAQQISYYADQPYTLLWPKSVDLAEPSPAAQGIAAPRQTIRGLLSELAPFVSERDVQRLLAAYGLGSSCSGERLWRRAAHPGGASAGGPGRRSEVDADV